MNDNNDLQHFILTRFNLLLWNKDKKGHKVRTTKWLEQRFSLFDRYCLPSIVNQTCKDFEWIVLFDNSTPERFKSRIAQYQKECRQFVPIYVEPEKGRYFAEIFREEVVKRINDNSDSLRSKSQQNPQENPSISRIQELENYGSQLRILTRYLDNDDALDVRFVEDLQQRALALQDGTFIYYIDGLQFYTDHKYVMKIHYPRNHFVSVVEAGNPLTVKTVYGYGSHYYIEKIKGAKIEYVENLPLWCEVIHEKNMGNDAYFLKAKMVKDRERLRHDFAIDETVKYGAGLYLFRFLPRYGKTFIRRCGWRLFGRHW